MSRAVFLGVLLSLLVPTLTYAQVGFGGEGADLTLSMSPVYPSPGANVHVEARSILMDLDTLTISWYKDGRKVGGGVGIKEIDIVAGALGSEAVIEAVVGGGGQAQIRITPTEVDLISESDSYVPPFYKGRAMPSAGTLLHLEAIPRFKRTDGSLVAPDGIIFTWKRGGSVIQSASGRGRATAVLESPGLFGTDLISVEARTPDDRFSGYASTYIASTEPRLLLYKDHPLFGVMYHQALGAQSVIPETEMSFVAVPYFAEAVGADDSRLGYAWRVNGNDIAVDPSRPSEITINASGSSGNALIELALSHATNFFMSSFGRWGITLSGGDAGDAFGGAAQ
jgi:hypothetical protein